MFLFDLIGGSYWRWIGCSTPSEIFYRKDFLCLQDFLPPSQFLSVFSISFRANPSSETNTVTSTLSHRFYFIIITCGTSHICEAQCLGDVWCETGAGMCPPPASCWTGVCTCLPAAEFCESALMCPMCRSHKHAFGSEAAKAPLGAGWLM